MLFVLDTHICILFKYIHNMFIFQCNHIYIYIYSKHIYRANMFDNL